MGRGRAKAKQTKVARELKYHSPEINLERLLADISGEAGEPVRPSDAVDDSSYEDDEDEYETGDSGRASSR